MAEEKPPVPTTIQSTTTTKKSVRPLRVLLAVILFILGFVLGALFYAYFTGNLDDGFFKQGSNNNNVNEAEDSDVGTDLPGTPDAECPATVECKKYNLPVVVFEAEGLFSAGEKNHLKDRVVTPMTEYVLETEKREAVSFAIKKYEGSGDYDYTILAIFEDGVNTGFLHGDGDAEVEWWFPTCLDECEFSSAYEAKFPDVVDAYENQ